MDTQHDATSEPSITRQVWLLVTKPVPIPRWFTYLVIAIAVYLLINLAIGYNILTAIGVALLAWLIVAVKDLVVPTPPDKELHPTTWPLGGLAFYVIAVGLALLLDLMPLFV